jgi:hypothetical protein
MEIDEATFQRNWRAIVAVCLAYEAILFDHFVGNREQRRWNAQSEHAILRLTTSSNLVGCSTGRSAGLAPLNVLSIDGKIPDDTVKVRAQGHAVQIRIAIMRRLFSK